MHILRVAEVPNNRTGGMSRLMYLTGDIIAAQGHTVDYLFGDELEGGRATLRRFTVPQRITRVIQARLAAGKSYDVVEIHEPLAWHYARKRQSNRALPALVILSHGLEVRSQQSKLSYAALKGIPTSLKDRYSPLTVTMPSCYAIRRAQHVMCVNSEDARYVSTALGVPADRVSYVNTGVTQDFLKVAATLPIEPASRRGILFLATWIRRKGTLDLIPAMTRLLREQKSLTFTVAGCGPNALLNDFPEDVRGQIRVVPRLTSQDELLAMYRQNSIFVLPSNFEGQPLVMTEAAACGLVIVTTACCGMLDFVRDGENGLLVPVGDEKALFQALHRVSTDHLLTHKLAIAGRATAQEFTLERSAKTMLSAFQAALQAR